MKHQQRLREIERALPPASEDRVIKSDLSLLTADERRELGILGRRATADHLSLSPEERERSRVLRDRIVMREERGKQG